MGGLNSGRKKGSKNKDLVTINGVLSKICVGPKCNGNFTAVSDFGKSYSYCEICDALIHKKNRESDFIGYKVAEINRNSKKRRKKGKDCLVASNIRHILEELVENQPFCYYSNVKLVEEINNPNSWSPERLNFNGHYFEDNTVLCTTLVNSVKGRIEYGIEELIKEYGEEIALRTLKNIIITTLKYYKSE